MMTHDSYSTGTTIKSQGDEHPKRWSPGSYRKLTLMVRRWHKARQNVPDMSNGDRKSSIGALPSFFHLRNVASVKLSVRKPMKYFCTKICT